MSDTPQGPGWWRASDGLWYPPETHPDYEPPAPQAGASYRPPIPPAPPERQPAVAPPVSTSPRSGPPPGPPPSAPETAQKRNGCVTAMVIGVGVGVALLVGLFVIGLLVGDDSSEDAAAISVETAGAPVPVEAFVTTGVRTGDGVLFFGTSDDAVAVRGEIWNEQVVTEGPGSDVRVGAIEVPIGVPYIYGTSPTDSGFIASGEVYFADSGASQTAVFTSPDGLDWSLTAPPGTLGNASAVYDVAVVGDLTLAVAVDDADGINRLYRSIDGGATWAINAAAGIEDATIWGMTADDDTFYAVGSTETSTGETRPSVFVSTDGIEWSPSRLGSASTEAQGVLYDVVPIDDGYLAVGTEFTVDGQDVLVMYSADGTEWDRVALPVSLTSETTEVLYSVIPADGGAIATGQIDDQYAFWEIHVGR